MLPTHKAEHLPLEQMLQSRIPSGSPQEGHTQIFLIPSLPNFTDPEWQFSKQKHPALALNCSQESMAGKTSIGWSSREFYLEIWTVTILLRGYTGHFYTWRYLEPRELEKRRHGMGIMQYRKFEQNFNMGPFPMQVKEQAQAERVVQWLWSSIRPHSPVKALREHTAHGEEQLLTQRKQKPFSEGPSHFPGMKIPFSL